MSDEKREKEIKDEDLDNVSGGRGADPAEIGGQHGHIHGGNPIGPQDERHEINPAERF
jgi:hypothetical protein